MKKILLVLFTAFLFSPIYSQYFSREVGIRGGYTSGFTYREYLDEYLSYEGILSFRNGGMQLTLLRQINEISMISELNNTFFIYGFGGHAGYFYSHFSKPFWNEYYYSRRQFSPVLGVDAYVGLEYRFDAFPLTAGLDFKPFFEFSSMQIFRLVLWDLALTAKYQF
jgi:hypothetical protein